MVGEKNLVQGSFTRTERVAWHMHSQQSGGLTNTDQVGEKVQQESNTRQHDSRRFGSSSTAEWLSWGIKNSGYNCLARATNQEKAKGCGQRKSKEVGKESQRKKAKKARGRRQRKSEKEGKESQRK